MRLARAVRGRITAIYVIPDGVPTLFSGGRLYGSGVIDRKHEELLRRHVRKVLSVIEEEARAAHVACASIHRLARDPWQAIVGAARSRKCDLVVMASHGRSGLPALLLGSQTMKVLVHSRTPVLVCR